MRRTDAIAGLILAATAVVLAMRPEEAGLRPAHWIFLGWIGAMNGAFLLIAPRLGPTDAGSLVGSMFGASFYQGLGYLYVRSIPHLPADPGTRLMFAGLALYCAHAALLFLVRRQKVDRQASFPIRAFTFFTTLTPLLARPWDASPLWLPGAWFGVAGTVLMIVSCWSLTRSYSWVPVHRGLKTRGLYRFVRHPMYASYWLLMVGYPLVFYSVWNVSICALAAFWGVLFAFLEERVLTQDPAYVEYTRVVRHRFIPGVV